MGYTHYWGKKGQVPEPVYKKALADIRKIVLHASELVPLAGPLGDKGTKPELRGHIAFNGVDEGSHETFRLPGKSSEMDEFDFTKTNGKPYDPVVVACLARLSEVPGIEVSSDGDAEDWADGLDLASKVLGRKVACPVTSR